MPGKDDGFFDSLFDLDGDGNTDVFEEAAGFMMLDELMNEEQDEADEDDEADPLFDRVTAYAPQKARKPASAARETPHEEPKAAEPAGDTFEEYGNTKLPGKDGNAFAERMRIGEKRLWNGS